MPILRGDFDKIVSDREGKFDVRNMIVHLCSVSQLSGLGSFFVVHLNQLSYTQEVRFISKTVFPFPLLRLYGRIKGYSLGLSPGWRLRSASCCQSHPPWKICPPPPPLPPVTLSQKPSLPQPPLAKWLKSTTIRRRRDPGILPTNVCRRVTCAWLR